MNIAIVDDEEMWRKLATTVVKKNGDDKNKIDTYNSGIDFLDKNKYYDIVIMDVDMPQLNGFDTITEYKKNHGKTIVIILTTHLDCARKGYLVNAFRYVDKTKMEEELEEAFCAIKKINENNDVFIMGKKDERTQKIYANDILYIETKSRKTMIHVQDGCYLSDKKINELEEKLKKYGFYRSHKSFLVNMAKVDYLDKEFVYFENNEKAYISVRKYTETKKRYITAKKKIASM